MGIANSRYRLWRLFQTIKSFVELFSEHFESVEIHVIKEITRELYKGANYETFLDKGGFTTKSYAKKVSGVLIKKLGEEHTDRNYTGRKINLSLVRDLQRALAKDSEVTAISVEYNMKSNKRPRNDPIIDYDSDVSSHDGSSGAKTDSGKLIFRSCLP